jgi:hypothetical protein
MNKIAKIIIVVASITLAFTACGEDKKKAEAAAKALQDSIVKATAAAEAKRIQDSIAAASAVDSVDTPNQKKKEKRVETDAVRAKIEEKKLAAQEAAKAAIRAKAAAEANK